MRKIVLMFLVIGLVGVSGAFAQYKPMLAANGIPVAAPVEDPFILPYGNSKIFIWGASNVVTAKRIEQDGSVAWTQEVASSGRRPHACKTSDGQIAIVWEDLRSDHDIYAHKFKEDTGAPFWGQEKAVATDLVSETHPQVCQDNAGGVFIAWIHADESLKMQHITSDGSQMWTSSGTLEVVSLFDADIPYKLLTNSQKPRAVVLYNSNIGQPHVILITSEAMTIEDDYGSSVGVVKKLGTGTHADIVESAGDYYTTWMTDEAGSGYNIYAARVFVSDDGLSVDEVNWGKTGRLICGAPGDQLYPKIVADAGGNSYVSWNDLRNLATPDNNQIDIYMLRLNPFDGSPATGWTANGNVVTDAPGIQQYYLVMGGGQAPAFHPMDYDSSDDLVYIAWHDYRNQLSVKYNTLFSPSLRPDIFMQVVQPDGSKLNSDLPICSLSTMEVFPFMYASSPTAFWYDFRSGSGFIDMYMQMADAIDTYITQIVTSPEDSNIKIRGMDSGSFGSDPDYANPDVALGSDYNKVEVNGTLVDVVSWTPTEITVNFSYDDLAPGAYTFLVTAYGQASNPVDISKAASDISIQNIYFDGVAYTSGMAINSSATVIGEITSTYSITSASIDVDAEGPSSLTLTDNQFSHDITSLSSGDHTIIISAVDSEGGKGSTTCNVSVSSVITISESSFNDKGYKKNDYVNSNTSFMSKIASDYSISELKLSAGTGGGAEINVLGDYDNGYLEIRDLGVHINLTGDVTFTLRAKDSSGNETSQVYYVSVAEQAAVKDVVATKVTATQDARLGFNYGGQSSSTITGVGAAATGESVKIFLYGPSGKPIMLNQAVTIGYNEVTLSKDLFDSNGIYIVKIYDGKRMIGKTRIVVLK